MINAAFDNFNIDVTDKYFISANFNWIFIVKVIKFSVIGKI